MQSIFGDIELVGGQLSILLAGKGETGLFCRFLFFWRGFAVDDLKCRQGLTVFSRTYFPSNRRDVFGFRGGLRVFLYIFYIEIIGRLTDFQWVGRWCEVMSLVASTVIFGIVETVLESIAWGTFGYIIFRYIGIKEKYWYWDCLAVYCIFLFWVLWGNSVLVKLDISIGNKEVLEFFDNDVASLFKTDFTDAALMGLQIFLGYMVGRVILNKFRHRRV